MSNIIVVNSTNSTSQKNVFQYNFIQGSYIIPEGSTIAVRQLVIPYSWFNINANAYVNNTFQYTWNGAVPFTRTVTLLDGYYTIVDINSALQLDMIAAGLYLIDSAGNNVYYIQILSNATLYANQILAFATPASLPSGYTAPANLNANFYSAVFNAPQFVVQPLITSAFSSIIGFSAGEYPTAVSTTSVSVTGNTTPNSTPVNSVIIRCNLVSNNVSAVSDIMDSFTTQGTSFGNNAVYSPNYDSSVALQSGRYGGFRIEFVDQNFVAIPMQDTNLILTLAIKFPPMQRI